jgi:tRNA (cytidine/uridine-2'-O-)-methyltransferase
MRLALYQPDIPQNTGTILRLAACLGVPVDIILPAGFDISDRNLRRAGMDYLDHVSLSRHADWAAFETWRADQTPKPRLLLLTSHASQRHIDATYRDDDILLLGRESAGVPDAVHAVADLKVRISMQPGRRSLNVAIAGGIVLAEALRQVNGFAPE